jgi:hypothetical protein
MFGRYIGALWGPIPEGDLPKTTLELRMPERLRENNIHQKAPLTSLRDRIVLAI